MAGKKGSDGDMVLGGGHLVAIFAFLVVVLGVVFSLGYLLGRSQFDGQLNPSVEAAMRRVDGIMGKPESSEKPGKPSATAERERPIVEHPEASPAKQPKDDVDFYRAGQSKAPEHLEQPPKSTASKAKSVTVPAVKPAEVRGNAAANQPAPQPKSALVPARTEVPAKADVPAKAATAPATVPSKTDSALRPSATLNTPPIPTGATVLQVAALVREADALAMAQALQQKGFPAFVLTPANDQFYRVQVGPYADARTANIARQGLENQGFKSIIKR